MSQNGEAPTAQVVNDERWQRLRSYLLWGGIGLMIRLLLMPFTFHVTPAFVGDIVGMNQTADALLQGGLAATPQLNYPPLAYALMGLFQLLFRPFTPTLFDASLPADGGLAQWLNDSHLFRHLFFLKLWYLPFDGLTAWLLPRLTAPRHALTVFKLWWLNPIVIYDGYLHGQFDVVVVALTVLALVAIVQKQNRLALLWLGLAACCKVYPVLFIPFAVLVLGQTGRERLQLALWGGLPVLVGFGLWAATYREAGWGDTLLLGASPFPLYVEPTSDQRIPLFFIGYALLFWHSLSRPITQPPVQAIVQLSFLILALYYAQAVFDLHYLTWIVPFAILLGLTQPDTRLPLLVILICVALLYLDVPPRQFFLPLNPVFIERLPSVVGLLPVGVPVDTLTGLVRGVMTGTWLWLAYRVWRSPQGVAA